MNERQRVCVILGAGASADVHGPGSKKEGDEFRPPLAKELFNINDNPAWGDIIGRYPGAKFLAQPLAAQAADGEFSMETALRKYAQHPRSDFREAFKHVPPYLRDLLYRSSNIYTQTPSSYAQLIEILLGEYESDVLFLTLNYDNLLEQALTLLMPDLKFENMERYIAGRPDVKVVKLHGSVNWFVVLNSDMRQISWEEAVKAVEFPLTLNHQAIIIKDRVDSVREGRVVDYNYSYPVVTAPLAGKVPGDIVCPPSHVAAAKEFLHGCSKFIIIGTSGLDTDLLDLLASSIPLRTRVAVQFVGKGKDTKTAFDRMAKKLSAFLTQRASQRLPSNQLFDQGFQEYLRSNRNEIQTFLATHL